MNKKGTFGFDAIIAGVVIGSILYLPFATPGFRVRKAVEACVAEGQVSDCDAFVSKMSKAEVLDYIRDDEVPGNQGNF